jgi:hypothetical protein
MVGTAIIVFGAIIPIAVGALSWRYSFNPRLIPFLRLKSQETRGPNSIICWESFGAGEGNRPPVFSLGSPSELVQQQREGYFYCFSMHYNRTKIHKQYEVA